MKEINRIFFDMNRKTIPIYITFVLIASEGVLK